MVNPKTNRILDIPKLKHKVNERKQTKVFKKTSQFFVSLRCFAEMLQLANFKNYKFCAYRSLNFKNKLYSIFFLKIKPT